MFSSTLSIRQNIKAVDTELSSYKVSNDARVDTLETFKATLEGDASVAGSMADLEAKHEEQSSLISTLETNANALKARIDSFNNALGENAEDGVISTIEQIKVNKDGLAQELLDKASEITRIEGLVSSEASTRLANDNVNESNLQTETANRITAVSEEATARASDVLAEQTARASAIALEVVDRNTAIAVETSARETAIEKVGFISTCEAEGLLEADTYPFCFGMGGQSEPKHGLPIPFSYTIRGIGYSCVSTDENPEIVIGIYHYAFINLNITAILVNTLTITGKSFKTKLSVNSFAGAGHLVVKVLSVNGLTDENSKFRLSLVLTSNESLYE